ncbi:4593_t:CDS:2 [Ambispora leptoticha]|uniref:4593_t:CDS:1 n=1 Tax=Ambispora leptoticha TaxID=144679 RepID=A0A9N9F3C0_9GLOM|nr:4593_t:CDS:2 [Ambispora leptoticha]
MSISSLDFDSRRPSEDIGGGFAIRPSFAKKFNQRVATDIINKILSDRLKDAIYDKDQAPGWAHEIAEEIKKKLLELDLNRYKYVVNVTIMENKGEGARMQCQCYWDSDTDNIAQEVFTNESLICVAVAFGVYLY